MKKHSKTLIDTLTVLTSFSTLICCALPALFVALGAGAALVGIVSAVPQLVWLSEHKTVVFIVAGIMLLVSGVMRYISRHAPCPLDPDMAKACMKMRRISRFVYIGAVIMYVTGLVFAFIAPMLMET